MCIRWLINWSDSTKMHGVTIRFIRHGVTHGNVIALCTVSWVKLNSYCEVLSFSSFDVEDSGLLGCDSGCKGYTAFIFRGQGSFSGTHWYLKMKLFTVHWNMRNQFWVYLQSMNPKQVNTLDIEQVKKTLCTYSSSLNSTSLMIQSTRILSTEVVLIFCGIAHGL